MDILELLKTIKEDWALLVFVFGLGAAWYQGKMWFTGLNKTLDQVGIQHDEQNQSLLELHTKLDTLDNRVTNIEVTSAKIHEEFHKTEIKLAILENTQDLTQVQPLVRRRKATH